MINKNVIVHLLVIVVLISFMTGGVAVAEELKGKVTMWGGAHWMKVAEGTLEKAGFYEKYPNVKVEITGFPFNDIARKERIAVGAGSPRPDVLQTYWTILAEFMEAGAVIDLTERIEPMKNDLLGLEAVTDAEGKTYGLNYDSSMSCVYYRKDIFEQHGISLPETHEEWIKASEKLNALGMYITGFDPETVGTGYPNIILSMIDGNHFNDKGEYIFDTEEGKGLVAIEAIKTYMKYGYPYVLEDPEGSTAFVEGKIPSWMSLATTWKHIGVLVKPGMEGYGEWRIGEWPAFKQGGRRVGLHHPAYLFINKNSKNKEIAWEVVKFLCASSEGVYVRGNEFNLIAAGYVPGLKKLAEGSKTWEFFGGHEAASIWAKSILDSRPPTVRPHRAAQEIEHIAGEECYKMWKENLSPEEVIKVIGKRSREAIRKY